MRGGRVAVAKAVPQHPLLHLGCPGDLAAVESLGEAKQLHPLKQTWNLKMDPWKRKFLLETIISRFHVEFQGCMFSQQNMLIWYFLSLRLLLVYHYDLSEGEVWKTWWKGFYFHFVPLYSCTLFGNKVCPPRFLKVCTAKARLCDCKRQVLLAAGGFGMSVTVKAHGGLLKRRKRQGIHVVEARSLLSCLTRRTFDECFWHKQNIDLTRRGSIHLVWEFQELSSGKMVGLLGALATLAAFAFSSDQERSLGSESVFSSNLSDMSSTTKWGLCSCFGLRYDSSWFPARFPLSVALLKQAAREFGGTSSVALLFVDWYSVMKLERHKS